MSETSVRCDIHRHTLPPHPLRVVPDGHMEGGDERGRGYRKRTVERGETGVHDCGPVRPTTGQHSRHSRGPDRGGWGLYWER